MAKGFFRLYEEDARFDLRDLIARFERRGCSLVHPLKSEECMVETSSSEGEPVWYGRMDLFDAVSRRPESFNFTLWLSDGCDTFCELRFVGSWVILEFGLNGLGFEDLEILAGVLFETLLEAAARGVARGIVFDVFNATECFDWDGLFFRGGDWGAAGWPDLIGFQASRAIWAESRRTNDYVRTDFNDFVLFYRNEEIGEELGIICESIRKASPR